ncbi:MAG: protein phosphatase 2C domain-containing protein [Blastocatellia bacterium]
MPFHKMTTGSVTDRGLHPRRKVNEDNLLVMPEKGLFVVADGVGGRAAGQVASQTVVDVFRECFAGAAGSAATLLQEAIARSNRRIYEGSVGDPDLSGMATTIAAVVVENEQAIVAHVGDSRVYRYDGQHLYCETEDHSEVAEAVRTGDLTQAQAARSPQRNIITRALGIEPNVEADFGRFPLSHGTTLLLCSDGVTRHVSDAEIETLLRSGSHPEVICRNIKDLCYQRGAEDNLTAVVVDFGQRAYADTQTRPMAGVPRVAATPLREPAGGSRISVNLGGGESTGETADSAAIPVSRRDVVKARQAVDMRTRGGGSLMGALAQLLVLGLLLAAAFYAGRNYEKLYELIWGQPATLAASSGSNGSAAATSVTGAPPVTPAGAAVTDAPDTANPAYAAARGLFAEKRYELAREEMRRLADKEPANADYRYWLGRAQLETKQFADAVKNLSEAARLNEKLPHVFLYLAQSHDGAGNRQAVSENLRKAAREVE